MKSVGSISLGTIALCLGLVTVIAAQAPATKTPAPTARPTAAPAPAVSHQPARPSESAGARSAKADDYNALVKRYCVTWHNDRNKDRAGSLTLASFDFAKAGEHAEVSERVIRKMQASMMPPPGMPRPDPAVYQGFIRALETNVDAYAKANPNPGGRTFPRLNRAEYSGG